MNNLTKMKVFVFLVLAVVAASAKPSGDHNVGIIGSRNAKTGEFPYVVSLQRAGDLSESLHYHACGGIIISPTAVLTAAQCVTKTGEDMIVSVKAGLIDQSSSDFQEINVDKFIIHPNYDLDRDNQGKPSLNDIAIVKLKNKLVYNDNVNAIALPRKVIDVAEDSEVQFAGWGYQPDNDTWVSIDILQVADYMALDYDTCNTAVKAIVQDDVIQLDKSLTQCVGPLTDKNGLVNTRLDTGGPLVQNGKAVGVASWNVDYWALSAAGKKGPAGIFTNVLAYVSWIKQNVDDL